MSSKQTCFNELMDNWARLFVIAVFTVKILYNNKAQPDRNTQQLLEAALHILLHLFHHTNICLHL